jgi:hypothetical protein
LLLTGDLSRDYKMTIGGIKGLWNDNCRSI